MLVPLFNLLCVLTATAHAQGIDWAKRLGNRKIDCGVSAWADWKCVGSTCTRQREVTREARGGGLACPVLVEHKLSNSKEDPWDKSKVVQRVQSKFISGNGRVLSQSKTKTQKGGKVLQSRDLMFLVDMSGSISKKDFHKTKQKMGELISYICGQIGSGRQNNRISVVTFSSSIRLNFDFKTHYDLKGVQDAIMKIPQERKLTCTGDAFHFASTFMFDPKSGVRDATESVKEVLVLTDGRSNCGKDLQKQIKNLQIKAFVFALAIGNFSPQGKKEIESMVSRPLIDHLFSLSFFEEFYQMVDSLKGYTEAFGTKCVPFELAR